MNSDWSGLLSDLRFDCVWSKRPGKGFLLIRLLLLLCWMSCFGFGHRPTHDRRHGKATAVSVITLNTGWVQPDSHPPPRYPFWLRSLNTGLAAYPGSAYHHHVFHGGPSLRDVQGCGTRGRCSWTISRARRGASVRGVTPIHWLRVRMKCWMIGFDWGAEGGAWHMSS